MKRIYIVMSMLVVAGSVYGKVNVPTSKATFFDMVARYPHAVVHYIDYSQVGDDKLKKAALHTMKLAFQSSANESAHVLAGLRYIGINAKAVPELAQLYKLQDDFSTILLFKDGEVLKDEDGNIVKLTEAFDQNDLGIFIQKYFGEFITRAIQEAQARRAAEPAQVRTVTRVVERPVYRRRYYPGYYRRGYYGRGYGYGYGPRIGFGFGFGGRRRRRGGVYFGF